MDYRVLCATTAGLIALGSIIPYFIGIFRGTLHPHIFSWIIWSLTTGIAAVAQFVKGAGPGSWPTAIGALISVLIVLCSLKVGEKKITLRDWISFLVALGAIVVWILSKDPFWSVVIVACIDAVAFYPTIRKSLIDPYSESAAFFSVNGVGFILSIVAIIDLQPTNWIYPASAGTMNFLFVSLLLARRLTVRSLGPDQTLVALGAKEENG
jgi:hypothetical protein